MPRTRFQGSKRKLAAWICTELERVEYDTVLDAFGGTGSIAYELKARGKAVTYNDVLKFNHLIGQALIENHSEKLSTESIGRVITRDPRVAYGDFIERTFGGIYFTDDENRWLDTAAANIARLASSGERAVAFYALFQAALAKRPYNLFHRANLYMRQADVTRTFGNKVTWDRSFDTHFQRFAAEANHAVFDNGRSCTALNRDVLHIEGSFDLVYLDPPYINARGVGVNYTQFYHFLEGLADYRRWPDRVDYESKHRRFLPSADRWSSPSEIARAFEAVFERFTPSAIVVSYRSDGIPSVDELRRMLKRFKTHVRVVEQANYQYALSTNKRSTEVLFVAT